MSHTPANICNDYNWGSKKDNCIKCGSWMANDKLKLMSAVIFLEDPIKIIVSNVKNEWEDQKNKLMHVMVVLEALLKITVHHVGNGCLDL